MRRETRNMKRRDALKLIGGTAGGILIAPMINIGRFRVFAGVEREYSARTIDLIRSSLVIDMTAFLTMNAPKMQGWFSDPDSYPEEEWKRSGPLEWMCSASILAAGLDL